MARTPEQIVKEILGEQIVRIATLMAQIETLSEEVNKPKEPSNGSK